MSFSVIGNPVSQAAEATPVPLECKLTDEERLLIRKTKNKLGDLQGNRRGKCHKLIRSCVICKRAKHKCRWETRRERERAL